MKEKLLIKLCPLPDNLRVMKLQILCFMESNRGIESPNLQPDMMLCTLAICHLKDIEREFVFSYLTAPFHFGRWIFNMEKKDIYLLFRRSPLPSNSLCPSFSFLASFAFVICCSTLLLCVFLL